MIQKILIVEDSKTFRQQLTLTLESRGYQVMIAASGPEAIEILQKQNDFVAVISDVHMPDMNGIEMVKTIRKEKHYQGPVMFLTTEGDYSVIREGRNVGASCWLVKPFQPNTLLSALEKIITIPHGSVAAG